MTAVQRYAPSTRSTAWVHAHRPMPAFACAAVLGGMMLTDRHAPSLPSTSARGAAAMQRELSFARRRRETQFGPERPVGRAAELARYPTFAGHSLAIAVRQSRGRSHRKDQTHEMTSSARKSALRGMVNPIVLATFRLTTNSSFVGCSNGRSPGFAPFSICAAISATRRNIAA